MICYYFFLSFYEINVKEYRRGNQKKDNPEKRGNTRRRKNKNTTQYVSDTTVRKQTQKTQIRHEPSHKQLKSSKFCICPDLIPSCSSFLPTEDTGIWIGLRDTFRWTVDNTSHIQFLASWLWLRKERQNMCSI